MTRTTDSYDVIVVGGGPSGSQVAYKLAGMGYIVGVVERKATLNGDVCCTGLVSRECVDKYAIPEIVIYRWANSARLFTPSGKPIHIQRDEPQVAVLNRSVFNQIWAQRAQKAGAEYHFGCNLKGIVRENGKVTAEVSRRGEALTLQSRAIVIATGFGTQLLDNLGLGGAGDFVMGAQAEVNVKDIDEVEVYFGKEVAPAFFAWLVPTLQGKALVGLLARRDTPFYLRKLLASLAADGKIDSAECQNDLWRSPSEAIAAYLQRQFVGSGNCGRSGQTDHRRRYLFWFDMCRYCGKHFKPCTGDRKSLCQWYGWL